MVSRAWTFNFLISSESLIANEMSVHMCSRLMSLDPRNENVKCLPRKKRKKLHDKNPPLQHVDDCANDLSGGEEEKAKIRTGSEIFSLLLRSRNKIWTNLAYECGNLRARLPSLSSEKGRSKDLMTEQFCHEKRHQPNLARCLSCHKSRTISFVEGTECECSKFKRSARMWRRTVK